MALDFLAGCLGGFAGVLTGHPMDTIKVNLQTQDVKCPKYRGAFVCLRSIIAKEGTKGLYRGLTSPLGGVTLVNAIVFGVYGNIQRKCGDPHSLYSHAFAGATAGLAQSFICSPIELAKTRLQIQENFPTKIRLKGPLQCLQTIYKSEGFGGLFRGLTATTLRDTPAFASYFLSYEMMMRQIPSPSVFHTLIAGGLAGTFSWLITFPVDTIKSRLQADGMLEKHFYRGILHCAQHGYEAEGLSFFSRGLSSTLIRAFLMNAATFLVVSYTMKFTDCFYRGLETKSFETGATIKDSSVPIVYVLTDLPNSIIENEFNWKRRNIIKSLVYSGTFTEAVCHSEMIELAYELHSQEKPYYVLDEYNSSVL